MAGKTLKEQRTDIKRLAMESMKRTNCDRMCAMSYQLEKVQISAASASWRPDMNPDQAKDYILAHVSDLLAIGIWAWYEMKEQTQPQEGDR